MMHKDIDRAVNRAFTKATPDVLSSVLSDCGEQKGTVIVMTENKRIPWGKRMAAMAAMLALILGIGTLAGIHYTNNTPVSTISLDVNPSIELVVNRNERVLEVNALNDDAQTVIGEMDLKGNDLDVAINALIGSMVRNGYISELANSVLISVDSKDAAKAAALQEKLAGEIAALLNTDSFSGAVISQTVTAQTELEQKAQQYSITLGKAQLIEKIVAQDSRYTFEALAKLSINELNLLSQSAAKPAENVSTSGTPSEKQYIGHEAAKAAALAHAGVTPDRVLVDIDYENGVMVYEVEFKHDGFEYEYDIDAATGAVVKAEKEADDDTAAPPANDTVTVDANAALETALAHAKLTKDQITHLETELDTDDGKTVIEISFKHGGFEYDYDIDAATGAILKAEKEWDDDTVPTQSTTPPSTDNTQSTTPPSIDNTVGPMTQDEALQIALSHAGLTKTQITLLEIQRDVENGKDVYEIDFHSGGYEYDYEIDVITGSIYKSEKEKDDDTVTGSTQISRDAAIEAALASANLTKSQVRELEAELNTDDGKTVYEVSFKFDGYEYDYEIDASSGKVLHSEKERDD